MIFWSHGFRLSDFDVYTLMEDVVRIVNGHRSTSGLRSIVEVLGVCLIISYSYSLANWYPRDDLVLVWPVVPMSVI